MAEIIALLVTATAIALTVRLFAYQRRSVALPASCSTNTLVVLVPVLREQRVIAETLKLFSTIALPYERYRIVVISTEAEVKSDGMPTTADVVDAVAAQINKRLGKALIRRVHYPYVHGAMAHQVNYGVRYLFEAFEREVDPDTTVLAVFNADSRPNEKLLLEAAQQVSRARPILQAPAEYFLQGGQANPMTVSICAAAAIWQTRWSIAVEYWRLRWGSALQKADARPGLLSPNAYVVGHGLFVRMRELVEVNYLPTFAPNEDAALGYLLPFYGVPVVPADNEDRAEVPLQARQLLAQQAGWIVGPLGAVQYAKYAFRNGLCASRWSLALAAAKVLWDALVWILGPLVSVLASLALLFQPSAPLLALVASFLLYLYVPSLLLWKRAPTMFPHSRSPYGVFVLGYLALPAFYVLHGVGGARGLAKLAISGVGKRPYVKYKTER